MADTTFIAKTTQILATWLNQVNRYVFGGATAPSIRSLDKTVYSRFRTLGYFTPGDGGAGDYYLDPLDTTSADNGGTVFVATDGGRWKLIVSDLTINLAQFGVDPTGAVSASAALQAAVTALTPTGGTIVFPPGTFKLDQTVVWQNTTNNSLPPIHFIGAGAGVPGRFNGGTVLKSYIANGPILNVIGTWITAGGTGNTFVMGGGLRDIIFDGTNATGTSQGLSILGWWFFEIHNCLVQNFPGDGITFYGSSGPGGIWGGDGDFTASALGFIEHCWVYNCAGVGINCSSSGGTISNTTTGLRFKATEISFCGTGCLITGSGTLLEDVSFSGIGFVPGSAATRGSGISTIVGTIPVGRPFGTWFQDCEWDFAATAHISLANCINTWFDAANQVIFRSMNGLGLKIATMTPPNGMLIAADDPTEAVGFTYSKLLNVRFNDPRPVTVFNLVNAGNVANVTLEDYAVSDGNYTGALSFTAAPVAATAGTLTAAFTGTTGTYLLSFSQGSYRTGTLTNGSTAVSWTGAVTDTGTTFYGSTASTFFGGSFLTGARALQNDYHLSPGGISRSDVTQESPPPFVPGRPLPSYVGTTLVGTSLTAATQVTVPFDTQEVVNATIYPSYGTNGQTSNVNFYSTVTHQFTAPVSAYYEIAGFVHVAGAAAADTFRVFIGSSAGDIEVSNKLGEVTSTGIMTLIVPTTVIYCAVGTTLFLKINSTANTRAVSTVLPSRLQIRMLGDVH